MLEKIEVFLNTTIGKGILFLGIILLAVLFEKVSRILILKSFEKSSKKIKIDATQFTFLMHLYTAVIYIIGLGIAISMIPSLKSLSISLFAGAGVLAVVIGFASQKAMSNIIAGIFIVIFRPFRVGDTIKVGNDKLGVVEDINLRQTTIKNFENKRYMIPNSLISEEIIENYNIGDEKVCKFFEIGISYDSNINKAIKIIQQEAEKHPDFLDTRTEQDKKDKNPAVSVRVVGFGDSSVNLKAWIWTKNPGAAFRLGCDLNKSIKEKFDKSKIEIPFPHRTIVYKRKKR